MNWVNVPIVTASDSTSAGTIASLQDLILIPQKTGIPTHKQDVMPMSNGLQSALRCTGVNMPIAD